MHTMVVVVFIINYYTISKFILTCNLLMIAMWMKFSLIIHIYMHNVLLYLYDLYCVFRFNVRYIWKCSIVYDFIELDSGICLHFISFKSPIDTFTTAIATTIIKR